MIDSRSEPPELLRLQGAYTDIPVYLGGLDAEILYQAQEIILSPGVSINEPAIQQAINDGCACFW